MPRRRSGHRRSALALVGSLALLLALTSPALAGGKRSVHVTKIDGAGNAIAGATFELFVDAAPKGGGPPKGAEDTTSAGTCTTDATGQCDITGLTPGDYWLSETGPPKGFTPAPDSQVKIEKGKPNPSVVVSDDKTPKSIRVNDRTADIGVGDGTHIFQFGPSVAFDGSGNLVVTFNDSTGLNSAPFSFTGVSTSNDRGATFTDRGELPVGSGGGFNFGQATGAFDPTRNQFDAASFFCFPNFTSCPIVFQRSTDNGQTWSDPVNVIPGFPQGPDAHTPNLVVDPLSGDIYIGWTESNGVSSQVFMSHSTDGGQTWPPPVPVSSVGHFDYPDVTVAPNGSVYVAFTSFRSPGGIDQNQFFVRQSNDGGVSFSAPIQVGGTFPASGHAGTCNGQPRTVLNGNIASQDPVQIAANPLDPNKVYMTFGSHGDGTDEADVFFSRSVDGGMTWTPPEPILPTPKDQFFPAMGITDGGKVGVFFFNRGYHAPLIDVSGVIFNGAGTEVNAGRLTPRSFRVPMLDPSFDTFVGDCVGFGFPSVVSDGSRFGVAWNDDRDAGPGADNGVDPNIYFTEFSTR